MNYFCWKQRLPLNIWKACRISYLFKHERSLLFRHGPFWAKYESNFVRLWDTWSFGIWGPETTWDSSVIDWPLVLEACYQHVPIADWLTFKSIVTEVSLFSIGWLSESLGVIDWLTFRNFVIEVSCQCPTK